MTRSGVVSFVVVLFCGLSPFAGGAQQEVSVPLDSEGHLMVVDAALAARLGIFVGEIPGFEEARLFLQLPDSSYILEISSRRDGQAMRDRRTMTAAEVEELRADLSRRLTDRAPAFGVDHEGRYRLLGGATLMGLALYGWAVPVMFDVEDDATAVGLYMLTAGASFFAPWLSTRYRSVSRGMADLTVYGATRGALHGILAHVTVAGEEDDDDGWVSSDGRSEAAAAMAGSLAEGLGGYLWARREGFTLAETRFMGLGGDFGMVQGLSVGAIVDGGAQTTAGLTLAGGVGGVAAGHRLMRSRDHSTGDVTALATAGWVGALTGTALVDLTGTENDRWFGAGVLVGSLGGLAVGDRLVRPTRFTEGQGRLVALGSLAGGAVGLGVAYLVVGEDQAEDESAVYLAAGSVGAMTGYALTYRGLAPRAPAGVGIGSGLELRFQPSGLLLAGRRLGSVDGARPVGGEGFPIFSATYRF